jgi:hypothetical protein
MATIFFHPSLLLLFMVSGSEIRDPGSGMGKNQDPGSAIRDKHPGLADCDARNMTETAKKVKRNFSSRQATSKQVPYCTL